MALKKEILTNCGISGNYIKISNYSDSQVRVLIWLDKNAREGGFEHLPFGRDYNLPDTILNEENIKKEGKSPLVLLYEYLKTLPEFEGAEDC